MSETIHIAVIVDEVYSIPCAVLLRSIIDNLRYPYKVVAYLLDYGLTCRSRHYILRSLSPLWIRVKFLKCDQHIIQKYPASHHVKSTIYGKLLIDRYLPNNLNRVIVFDADMIVRRCISHLWNTDIGSFAIGAVRDYALGYVGCNEWVNHLSGKHMDRSTPYFNSGLMYINLDRWRRDSIGDRAIAFADRYRADIVWWDQDAINCVVRGNFFQLDARWNVTPQIYYYEHLRYLRDVTYSSDELDRAYQDPWIVHFVSSWRPWKGPNRHWMETDFYKYLYRTKFKYDVCFAPWMGRKRSVLSRMACYMRSKIAL